MAIVGSPTAISTSESIDQEGHQNYTTVWAVMSDTRTESPIAAREAVIGIGQGWGSSYSIHGGFNGDAWCTAMTTTRDQSENTGMRWHVTVTHSTKPGSREKGGASGGLQTNPLLEPWRIGGSFVNTTRAVSHDRHGAPIQTTALERQVMELPWGYDTLTLEGPSSTISISTRSQAVRHCNETTIWGLTARQLYLSQWQYDIRWHGNLAFVFNRLEFWIDYEGWTERWLNFGTQHIVYDASGNEKIEPILARNDAGIIGRFLDANGQIIPESAMLDSGGLPLINPPVVINETEVIPEFDFTTLGFPDPLPGPFV